MNITAFSTALFSSWMFLEDLGICFDAGDGLTATLGLKSRKIQHIFVTHADRDHLGGLLQFNALNGTAKPTIHYPADCGSFSALRDFCAAFDNHTSQSTWSLIVAGAEIEIGKGLFVQALSSNHVQKGNLCKSLAFVVVQRTRKLRTQFSDRNISELRKTISDDILFEIREQKLFGYSGDGTPQPALWSGVNTVAHEATFIVEEDTQNARSHHSGLTDVLTMMAGLQPKRLILYHFSPRYSATEISNAIDAHVARLGINFPVQAILPGEPKQFQI